METKENKAKLVPSAVNDNGQPEGERPGGLDPRIRIIARAIGRQIAREHYAAWEKKRRRQAVNDNAPATPEPEEEGPTLGGETRSEREGKDP